MKTQRLGRVSLWVQLVFAVGLAIAVAVGSVAYLFHRAVSEQYASQIRGQVRSEVGPLGGYLASVAVVDPSALQSFAAELASREGARIVLFNGTTQNSQNKVVDTDPSQSWPPPSGFLSFPLTLRGTTLTGYFVIPDPVTSYLRQYDAALARTLLLPSLIGFLVGLGIILLLTRRIVRPLSSMTNAARRVGAGELSLRVPEVGPPEVAALALEFNTMASRLAESQELRQALVADVAHELRTPLTVVRGYLEAIRDHLVEADSNTINTIFDETIHLQDLVNDLQDLAQADAQELRLEFGSVDLGQLLASARAEFSLEAQNKGVELQVTVPTARLLVIIGDARRLAQVLHNLLGNALRYTPAGGRIQLMAAAAGNVARIEVRDTGTGISPEDLPFIFDRFYRVDKSRARGTGGSGLGLTIARRIIEAHHGTIEVGSELGAGTTFTIDLPMQAEAKADNEPPVA